MNDDEIHLLYEVADDGEADTLDHLRERAGIIWTHYGCWTNTVAHGKVCENCGANYDDLRTDDIDASRVDAWENE